ncbi:GGDEF domain-containing protein [Nocardia sp. NPDC005998]|uniref:GGDEF domain-containing protein n=1 Tax=Nocardia sp. NPDC005998 TaxID=3156894 RepID=UPI0033A31590
MFGRGINIVGLTGLPNRTKFIDALTAAFADPSAAFGLCYIDLDHFKLVNDTFGHAVGDELLIQAAARLRARARPGQLVARMDGDEFVILVPQVNTSDRTAEVAQTMLDASNSPARSSAASAPRNPPAPPICSYSNRSSNSPTPSATP